MTDKKNIINPDEDFELEGLSNFVENLNNDESEKDSSENNSDEVLNEELPSYLNNEDEEFNLDDLTNDSDDFNLDNLDSITFDEQDESTFDGESLDDSLNDLTSEIEALEENHALSDDDNISAEEFQNLSESNKVDEENFDIFSEDSSQDFNMEGITELGSKNTDKTVEENDNDDVLGEDFSFDSTDQSANTFENTVEDNNDLQEDWNNNSETSDWDNNGSVFDNNETEDLLNQDFETVDNHHEDEEDFNFDNDVQLDQEDIHTTSSAHHIDDNEDFSNDLDNQWDNNHTVDDFDDETVAADKDSSITPLPVPVPVPVKQGLFDKIKSKFSKKSKEEKEEELVEPNSHFNNNSSNSSSSDDLNVLDDFDDKPASTLLSEDKTPDEIEEEQKAKAKKSNIIKLSALAVAIALAAGGAYLYKNNMSGMDDVDSYAGENTSSPVSESPRGQDLNNVSPSEALTPSAIRGNNSTSGATLSTSQIEDLKKEILAQVSSERTALEQRVVNLEKENTVLKKVINEVQTTIDPDTINRFKVEFNDLNSKTKQLQVQFDDDQASNKTMATNFYAVLKKLNEDVQRVEQSAATQNSLDEQIKRIDNSFKQIVKMKDKEAEDNLNYRVDLIEKRMKFRNPNNDRSFEDKNNVKKVLSEGLFEGDTVKQEQQIPDIKYKYSFVGMIQGLMYLKTNSGDIKDFKVGDTLPGYGEILKINDNGSMETEKQGTVSFK